MTLTSAAILLFLVIDPLGNIPFFISALKNVDPEQHRKIIIRELLIALTVLVAFLFMGRFVLKMLHISEPALTIAGGVILFLIALRMIFPSSEHLTHEEIGGEPFIVPLAIPYVAGPSALTTALLLMSRESDRWVEWLLALILAWCATSIIILLGSKLRHYLGERGLIAIERLMGMVLITMAIQMLLTGIHVSLWQMP